MDPHRCDHKFIDSQQCIRCGWTPPPDANTVRLLTESLLSARQRITTLELVVLAYIVNHRTANYGQDCKCTICVRAREIA